MKGEYAPVSKSSNKSHTDTPTKTLTLKGGDITITDTSTRNSHNIFIHNVGGNVNIGDQVRDTSNSYLNAYVSISLIVLAIVLVKAGLTLLEILGSCFLLIIVFAICDTIHKNNTDDKKLKIKEG